MQSWRTYIGFGLWLALTLVSLPLHAGAAELRLHLEPSQPLLGQAFDLIIEVDGESSADEPQLPALAGLKLLGSSNSTNIRMGGSGTQVARRFVYTMQPQRPGSFTIPPISVKAGSTTLRSEPLKFSVSNAGSSPASSDGKTDSVDYFAIAKLQKSSAYVGEQVRLTIKLYYRTAIGDVQLIPPESNGFWLEEMQEAENLSETVEGHPYRVIVLHRALFANRPGKLQIGPATFEFQLIRNRRGSGNDLLNRLFNDPFFNVGVRQSAGAASKPLTLEVLPLPEAGRPANFSGLVGNLTVSRRLSDGGSTVSRGSSLTVTSELRGSARLRGELTLPWPADKRIKLYEDKPQFSSSITPTAGGPILQQARTYKTALVPLTEGDINLEPLRISYFEPLSRSYRVAETAALQLRVSPGDQPENLISSGGESAARPAKQLATDILANRDIAALQSRQGLYFGILNAWLPLSLATLMLLLGLIYPLWAAAPASALLKQQSYEQASRQASKQLQHLQRDLEKLGVWRQAELPQRTAERFYAIYRDYLGARLNLPAKVITTEELHSALGGAVTPLQQRASSLLNELEALRLNLGGSPPTPAVLCDNMRRLLSDIDQATGGRA